MTTATQIGREKEVQNLWDKFLDLIKSRVSINTYSTWFQPTRLNRAEGDTLYVQIPSTVFRQVLTRTYGEIVKAVESQFRPNSSSLGVLSRAGTIGRCPCGPARTFQTC